MRRDLRAVTNSFAEYEICYGNRFHIADVKGYNIKSSGFTVSGISGTVYLSDVPSADLEKGTINFFRLLSPTQPEIVRKDVGTIDYVKGEIKLHPVNIISTVINKGFPLIEIEVPPYSNDVIGLQDLYLQLDSSNVEMVVDEISSGIDPSGSNYIVTPSYTTGSIVR